MSSIFSDTPHRNAIFKHRGIAASLPCLPGNFPSPSQLLQMNILPSASIVIQRPSLMYPDLQMFPNHPFTSHSPTSHPTFPVNHISPSHTSPISPNLNNTPTPTVPPAIPDSPDLYVSDGTSSSPDLHVSSSVPITTENSPKSLEHESSKPNEVNSFLYKRLIQNKSTPRCWSGPPKAFK